MFLVGAVTAGCHRDREEDRGKTTRRENVTAGPAGRWRYQLCYLLEYLFLLLWSVVAQW